MLSSMQGCEGIKGMPISAHAALECLGLSGTQKEDALIVDIALRLRNYRMALNRTAAIQIKFTK